MAATTDQELGRMIRITEVVRVTGLSISSIYAMMGDGRFPRPVRIGVRAVAWPASTLRAWLATRTS